MAAKTVPPTGTVTFLFTDIEGSTELWEQSREAMEVALSEHDALLRRSIADSNGYAFATGGDGFAATFARAEEAVHAAAAVQRELPAAVSSPVRLRVRIGIHTGEAQERDDNYFGPAVNRAVRVMSIARGGEVLLSSTTADTVADRLPAGLAFAARRVVELSGVDTPMEVCALAIEGTDGPNPETPPPERAELPKPRTALFGRDDELESVLEALRGDRLVTVTGFGGVGKTRLAIEAAMRLDDVDTVRFVDLSTVRVRATCGRGDGGRLGHCELARSGSRGLGPGLARTPIGAAGSRQL